MLLMPSCMTWLVDETKNVTFLGVRLSPNSYIIWSDYTQSRFFSHFRYFWGENHKRSIFGRFRSEKVRKTTKSQKTLKIIEGDGVTGFNVTASWTSEVKKLEDYSWRARRFLVFRDTFGDAVRLGRQIWNEAAWRRQEGHHKTLIVAVTASHLGLTPSARIFYIYGTFLHVLRETFGGELQG